MPLLQSGLWLIDFEKIGGHQRTVTNQPIASVNFWKAVVQ